MSENENVFLCGGVLFFMLMKATFPDGSARDHKDGIKDEHKAPDVMSDLVYTFTGSWSYRSEKDTSNYRECKIEGTVNVPFNDESIINAYDDAVKHRYHEALSRMCEFSRWHINPAMKEWLVRSLLEVIEYDSDIKDIDVLYVLSKGSPMTKKELRKTSAFELEPFLVGVLHYILKNRIDKNQIGLSTLDFYGNKKARKEREHKGNAGQRITREIFVEIYEIKEDKIEPQHNGDSIDEPHEEDVSFAEDDNQGFASEGDTPDFGDTVESEEKKITVIKQQTNVIQNGENNFNLTNNGVMNFDFGGGKK